MLRERHHVKGLLLFALLAAGCGGMETPAPTSPVTAPVTPDASVMGPYDVVLTSTSGHGTTNIYADFKQTGTTLTGGANTLVCPSNDVSQCEGDAAGTSITPRGTVKEANITMTISVPNTAGVDTVTMVGTGAGASLAGTYTDSLGDAGTWTGSAVVISLAGTYAGTFNSTSNPLLIAPTVSMTLSQNDNLLNGTATIMNSLCIRSLSLSGQQIGQAFSVTDATSKAHILAVPTGNNFTFSYSFEASAPSCPGDFGVGTLTGNSPWDY